MAFALLGTLGSYYWRENPSNRTTWLVIVTTLFHAWIDPLGAVFLWFLAWLVRFLAKRIESSENPVTRRTRTRIAVVGVIVPLVCWRSAQELLDFASGLGLTNVALDTVWRPVALGLILLQAVITIVDVSRKDAPTPSLRETVLLLGFYPRALAGPLVRTGSFCYNLQQKWTGEIPLGKVAMLIVSAAFQRYVIVESLARYGQSMSANRENLNMFDALLWLASGPVRVVADITAYSYLAVAAALVCGVKLPYDMKSPFQGHTPGELSILLTLPNTGSILLTSDAISRDSEVSEGCLDATDPAQAIASANRILDLAKAHNAYVIYGHGPEQWKELKKAPDLYN